MLKFLLLGDPHAGVQGGSKHFIEYQTTYLKWVLDYCKENGIYEIWCAGDMFEVRKSTNTEVLASWKANFFDLLEQYDIVLRITLGNHDMYYKNVLSPNALEVHLSSYDNIVIYDKPTELKFGKNHKMLFVPWMCEENEEASMDAIKTTDANMVLGHFEVKGAKMESSVCEDGLPLSTFNKFTHAFSGHFHIRGQYENMLYIGTPYQTSWADLGEAKGIHVLAVDPDTDEIAVEFFENLDKMYHKIIYRESTDMDKFTRRSEYEGKYVRVVVEEREDFRAYEEWLHKMSLLKMKDLKIIEPFGDRDQEDSSIEFTGEIDPKTTNDLMSEYIEEVYPERKDKLTPFMASLLSETQRKMS